MATTYLTGSSAPRPIAPGYSLEAPGLTGRVSEQLGASTGTTRSGSLAAPSALDQALEGAGIEPQRTFELDVRPAAPGGSVTRGGAPTGLPATGPLVLRVPVAAPNQAQAVLYTDEAGAQRWLLPEAIVPATGIVTRGGGGGRQAVFHLPREGAVPPATQSAPSGAARGSMTAAARRLVKVVTWATDEIVGAGALAYARKWEGAKRPYGFVRLPPGQGGQAEPLEPSDLAALTSGPVLLLLHGTFSRAVAAFSQLVQSPHYRTLFEHYEGRVVAFDHPSVHQSPAENVVALLDRLPREQPLEFDLLTHSRGGLVGRELAARAAEMAQQGRPLSVRRALLVASPNQGTLLADGDNWISFVDRYTNLLLALPDNAYTLTMEGVLIALKLLAHGALGGLPGLQSLVPKGDFLRRLNSGPAHQTAYYGIAADFTPANPSLRQRFGHKVADKFLDTLFGEENDMVVPARGSFEAGLASPGFPIPAERRRLFDLDAKVHHCNYFASEAVNAQVAAWLGQPA